MPAYRLEIERGDTLWVTADDEQGAIEISSAHIADEVALTEHTSIKLMHDADDTLILRAVAAKWSARARP